MRTPSDNASSAATHGRGVGDRDGAGGSHQGEYGDTTSASSTRSESADERGVFGPAAGNGPGWGEPDQGYGGSQFGGRSDRGNLPLGGYDSARGGRPYGGENFGGTSGYGGHHEGRYAGGRRAGAPHAEFDPDYHQWRTEHLDSLDQDYRRWRQDRYAKFAEEFDRWRKERQR